MNKTSINEKYFPALNLSILSEYAREWVEDYHEVPIKKIILNRAKLHTQISILVDRIIEKGGRTPRSIQHPKYEIIFILPESDSVYQGSMIGVNGEEALKRPLSFVRGEIPSSPMQTFLDVIEYDRSPYDNSPKFKYLMPKGQFEDVYRQHLSDDSWRNDWKVAIRYLDPDMDSGLGDTNYVLYSKIIEKIAPERVDIKEIITPLCFELKKFYNRLVNEIDIVGNYKNIDEPDQSELYGIALDFFDQTQSEYIHIKKAMIEDEDIYAQKSRRPRRIIGMILQKYIEQKGISKHPFAKLHALYNEIIL